MSGNTAMSNRASPLFKARYPTPGAFLEYVRTVLDPEARNGFVADRVLARLGVDAVVGGSRAAGFSPTVLAKRGVTDLDVGLLGQAESLLALEPQDRLLAMDELVRGQLSADLGDYVALDFQRIEANAIGAFYRVKARIDGAEVGRIGLDIGCDPHITAPLIHSFFPLSNTEIPGLPLDMHTYQNPADVLAEKAFAVYQCAAANDRPRYAKHLCDLRSMLESKDFDPYYVAVSLKELSRTSGVRLSQIYPLQYLRSASDRYRARRKKLSPGVKLPLHVMREDFGKLRPQLEPVVREAYGDDRRPLMTREEFATVIRDLWLPPVPPPRTNPSPVGSHPVHSAKVSPYRKHIVLPGQGSHLGPSSGSPPQDWRSKTSRGR